MYKPWVYLSLILVHLKAVQTQIKVLEKRDMIRQTANLNLKVKKINVSY